MPGILGGNIPAGGKPGGGIIPGGGIPVCDGTMLYETLRK